MRKSRFCGEQIIHSPQAARRRRLCALGTTQAWRTFCGWKLKYGGMEVDEARRLRSCRPACASR